MIKSSPTIAEVPLDRGVISCVVQHQVSASAWETFIRSLACGSWAQLDCPSVGSTRPGVRITLYGTAGDVRVGLEAPKLAFCTRDEQDDFLATMHRAFNLATFATRESLRVRQATLASQATNEGDKTP